MRFESSCDVRQISSEAGGLWIAAAYALGGTEVHEKPAPEEYRALEAQNCNLQMLVADLLLSNQQLRLEVDRLREQMSLSAPAIHPPPRPDR